MEKAVFRTSPTTKATNILLNRLDKLLKTENAFNSCLSPEKSLKSPGQKLRSTGNTPIAKRTRKSKYKTQNNTLNTWLSKPKTSENKIVNPNSKNKSLKKTKPNKEKPIFARFSSNESISDLPKFSTKKSTKNNKTYRKKMGELKIKDILKEQNDLVEYKRQVLNAQLLEDPLFDVSLDNTDKSVLTVWLDCKHLTFNEITQSFQQNKTYLKDIINGKKYSERHVRFNNYNKQEYDHTTKDLKYNTSMIVFTFEQHDHIISLMQKKFDPDDKKSAYFFQVLLPEFCLKVFMDTHKMTRKEALEYLDIRPVE